jgi:hypothetical protein
LAPRGCDHAHPARHLLVAGLAMMKLGATLLATLLVAGCTAASPSDMTGDDTAGDDGTGEDPSGTGGDSDPGTSDPGQTPPDDPFEGGSDETPGTPVDNYQPKAFTASRFGVFYQVSQDVLDLYQSTDKGLPKVAGHAYLITQSHATAFASKGLADLVHRRADFYYAPAFDIWDASHDGWQTATDAQLKTWAHDFRDKVLAAHADLFTFNEVPTSAGTSDNVRVRVAKILRFLHEPDAQGRVLWGVTYLTEKSATPSTYDGPQTDYWKAIDQTSIAVIAEHYHSTSFMCSLSEADLATHLFALRRWLVASNDAAKLSIANKKLTILHSSRFNTGTSGWAGGNSDVTSLAMFQRALSRVAKVTRATEGGVNRMSFAPTTSAVTMFGVQPRIAGLFRWHYLHSAAQTSELPCIDNFGGNCTCE